MQVTLIIAHIIIRYCSYVDDAQVVVGLVVSEPPLEPWRRGEVVVVGGSQKPPLNMDEEEVVCGRVTTPPDLDGEEVVCGGF